jgi:hypothetical protein
MGTLRRERVARRTTGRMSCLAEDMVRVLHETIMQKKLAGSRNAKLFCLEPENQHKIQDMHLMSDM